MKWLSPTSAEKKLSFPKEDEVNIILLVQSKNDEYHLVTFCKWANQLEGWLDAPLIEFAFGEWNPYVYKRIAIVEGQRRITKGTLKNGFPDLDYGPIKFN